MHISKDLNNADRGQLGILVSYKTQKGMRLVIAQVLDDVKEERRHALRKVFGEKD